MPETEGEVQIELKLCDETLRAMLNLKENEMMLGADGTRNFTAIRKNGRIHITFAEWVTLEFDMSDYAPDWDEP